jgi:hypothetical protein
MLFTLVTPFSRGNEYEVLFKLMLNCWLATLISLQEVSQTEVYEGLNNCLHMNTCLQSIYAKLSGILQTRGQVESGTYTL